MNIRLLKKEDRTEFIDLINKFRAVGMEIDKESPIFHCREKLFKMKYSPMKGRTMPEPDEIKLIWYTFRTFLKGKKVQRLRVPEEMQW